MSSHNFGNGAFDLSTLAHPSGSSSSQYEVTTADFATEVLEKSQNMLIIVHLGSSNNAESIKLSTVLTQLAASVTGQWQLAEVNCDTSPEIPAAFRIRTLPTVVAIYDSRPIAVLESNFAQAEIFAWINAILTKLGVQAMGDPQEHPDFLVAQQAIAAGNTAEALAQVQKILAEDPHNEAAVHLKKNIEFLIRVNGISPDCIDFAAVHPDSVTAQCDAADYLLFLGQITQAFELLISAFSKNKSKPEIAQPIKEHLCDLFTLFSPDSPEVKNARIALSNAIF